MLKCCLMIFMSLLIASCHDQQAPKVRFHGLDITNATYAQDFELTDHFGEPKRLKDYQSKVVVIVFGYTHCPDICPTTLADMAKTMNLLGNKRDLVQVLFITLDPERDTQEVLAKFAPGFDQTFVGLYGSDSQVKQVAKDFKVFSKRQNNPGLGSYTIDHSAGMYAYDRLGKLRLYFKYGQKPVEIANDLKKIM